VIFKFNMGPGWVELKFFSALLISFVVVAGPAWGQAGGALTLGAALQKAERQNLDLVAARARQAIAQAGIRIAGERPNPTLTFGALRDSPHEFVTVDQPLEIGPKRGRRIELARQESVLTDVEIRTLERQVRRSVREAFFGLALARGISGQKAEALKLAERLHGIAKERFDAGDVAELEVVQADLEVSRADAEYQVARQEEKIALNELDTLLNEPAATDWDLAGALDALPPRMMLDDLVGRAINSNYELQHLVQETKVEQSRESLLRAERIPNLGVQVGTDFNAPNDFRVGPRGQISIDLPIFMRNQGEIAQSSATLRALDRETAATRRSVAGQVGTAYFDLDARLTEAEIFRKTLLPATERLENMAEESYRAGKANILTVLSAQHDVQQVHGEYLNSLFNAQSAFAKLEETVGVPLD
jgi:cobalt-zinc-cadmium efflux system outer membrane protein